MPPVKKKSRVAKRKKQRARQGAAAIEEFLIILRRVKDLALAGIAGLLLLTIVGGVILWAGGYVGLLGERVERSVQSQVVQAGFGVKRITVRGRHDTQLEELESAIGPIIGESILHLDLHAARARVENLGWVRSAAVSRLWPNTLHVSIRERSPAAVWQMSGDMHLIDDDGAIIRQVGAYEYSSLPLIVGAGAPEAAAELLKALKAHPDLEERIAALVRVGNRRWNIRLHNRIDIKLPETGLVDALEALSIIHTAHGALDQQLEYIDLRDSERVIVRPRKDAELNTTG